jgi:hypothetical protein
MEKEITKLNMNILENAKETEFKNINQYNNIENVNESNNDEITNKTTKLNGKPIRLTKTIDEKKKSRLESARKWGAKNENKEKIREYNKQYYYNNIKRNTNKNVNKLNEKDVLLNDEKSIQVNNKPKKYISEEKMQARRDGTRARRQRWSLKNKDKIREYNKIYYQRCINEHKKEIIESGE